MQLLAPAKVNLFLDILGKRMDGYHEIQTIMHEIDLCDTVRLEKRERDVSLACSGLDAPTGPENLACRAAELFLRETGVREGVHIELTKRIPAERGLGGGSSDAAAVLRGMNRLFAAGLADEVLMAMAGRLGSDIPFFIKGGTALCEGRGERVTPIECSRKLSFTLLMPPFGLRTASVYGELERNDLTPSQVGAKILVQAVKGGDLESIASGLYNRLEAPSFRLSSELRVIRQQMAAFGFLGVLMSGSGTAIFGVAPDLPTAESLAKAVAREQLGGTLAVCTYRCGDRD